MKLTVQQLACGYDRTPVISDISLEISSNETLALLGPNGVGKTTFFKTMLGLMPPLAGEMTVNGIELSLMTSSQRARIMAYVPQAHEVPFPFSVEEVVVMGRNVYMNSFSGPTEKDHEAAAACMQEMGVEHLRKRIFTQLSGGERQLVLIARALAQRAQFLIMDEPASNLDFGNQMKVLDQINRLKETGKGIIFTTHSPDHALLCSTKVAVFHKKHPVEIGPPQHIITNSLMYRLYGVHVNIHEMRRKRGDVVRMCIPCR
jgi:iron complex transport system ATP-binding protein